MRQQVLGCAALALAFATTVQTQIAVSSNDRKQALVNGIITQIANPPPDSLTILTSAYFRPG